jgi:hypothetical protein
MEDKKEIDTLKLVYEHAWNWFSHHAEQRMTAMRFFLLFAGIFAVGYYQTLNNRYYLLSACFAALTGSFSILFWRLDLRTRELIKVGEDLIAQAESELEKLTTIKIHIIQTVDAKTSTHTTKFMPSFLYSYGQIFSAIFKLILLFSVCAAIYSLFESGAIQAIKQKFCAP